jgi:hypothetical protein
MTNTSQIDAPDTTLFEKYMHITESMTIANLRLALRQRHTLKPEVVIAYMTALETKGKARRAALRRGRTQLMQDMGLVRGKDSMGRTIWE